MITQGFWKNISTKPFYSSLSLIRNVSVIFRIRFSFKLCLLDLTWRTNSLWCLFTQHIKCVQINHIVWGRHCHVWIDPINVLLAPSWHNEIRFNFQNFWHGLDVLTIILLIIRLGLEHQFLELEKGSPFKCIFVISKIDVKLQNGGRNLLMVDSFSV